MTKQFKPSKTFLQNKLANLLDYRNIHVSNAELRSYRRKELNQLVTKYQINLNNACDPNNYWYKTTVIY